MRLLLACTCFLFCIRVSAQVDEATLDAWIKQSSAIFVAKARLSDTGNPDYHLKTNSGHIYVETLWMYYFPDEDLQMGPEFYLHYTATLNGFHPKKSQTSIFFVRHVVNPAEPDYWVLVGDSVGAIPFSSEEEKKICAKLYSQRGDSASCNALSLKMDQLNGPNTRLSLVNGMFYAPDAVWDKAKANFLCVLQNENYNATAKLTAMYLLGARKTTEAIPLLVSRIGEEIYPENSRSLDESECQSYEALKMIGKPAYEALEKHLDQCKDYQEFKMTVLTMNSITPFKNKKATNRFTERHYKTAPEQLKPFYRFMMQDLSGWEKEVRLFNERRRF